MTMHFTKAERKKAKLRLALAGPSGSGKTFSALLIAKGIGGKIAVIDTEHESASLYAGKEGMPEFDSLNLRPPYTPERFIEAIATAEAAGFDILIIDSLSHEWNGSGGCLELNDELARSKFKGNTWSAWNETTPRHRKLLDKILASSLHIIATMRSKTETAQTEQNGRKTVVKLGMKAEQREGSEYEFTTVLDLVHDGHFATASKDRTGLFAGLDPKPVTEATGTMLLEWLESGAELTPEQKAEQQAQQQGVLTEEQIAEIRKEFGELGIEEAKFLSFLHLPALEETPAEKLPTIKAALAAKRRKLAKDAEAATTKTDPAKVKEGATGDMLGGEQPAEVKPSDKIAKRVTKAAPAAAEG